MNQLLSIAESEHLLKKVIEDGDAPWGVLGLLIESVDHHNSWVVEYESFTEWMRALAKKLDKKEGSVWRCKTSFIYFLNSQKKLVEYGLAIPNVYDLSKQVSAENLEILSKIEAVAPDDVLYDLYEKVYSGTIRRMDLRDTWLIFRSEVQEKIPNRRNGKLPKSTLRSKKTQLFVPKSSMMNAVKEEFNKIIDVDKADIYRFLLNFEIKKNYFLDAMIVVKFKRKEINLHIIYTIESYITEERIERIESRAEYGDYLWIVCDRNNVDSDEILDIKRLEWVGIITVHDDKEVDVKRVATMKKGINRMLSLEKVLLKSS
jgi:hypothetical protein